MSLISLQIRSVEKGTEILPPFDTAIGRVGLSICFDVSDPRMNILITFLEEKRAGLLIRYICIF